MATTDQDAANVSDAAPPFLGRTYRVNLLDQSIPNELADVIDYQHGFFFLHFLKRTTPGNTSGWIAASQITSMYELPPKPAPRPVPEAVPESGEEIAG